MGVFDHRLRWLGIEHRVKLLDGDLADLSSLMRIVKEVMPHVLAFSEVVAQMDSVDDEQVRHRLAELKAKIPLEINIVYVERDGSVKSVSEWVDDDVS